MFDEFFDAIPLLIDNSKFKEHNISELEKCKRYHERRVKEYEALIKKYSLGGY